MYAFRALNDTDLQNLLQKKGLLSYDPEGVPPFDEDGTIHKIVTS